MPDSAAFNPTAPTFEVQLDRLRHLKFTMNSVCAIEGVTGKNMLHKENWSKLFAKMNLSTVRLLVWSALIWEDPKLTLEDVGEMFSQIGQDKLPDVLSAVNQAIEAHTLKAEADRPLAEGTKVPVETAT